LEGGIPETLAASSSRSARLPFGQKTVLCALLNAAQSGALLMTCRYPIEELKVYLATLPVAGAGAPASDPTAGDASGGKPLPTSAADSATSGPGADDIPEESCACRSGQPIRGSWLALLVALGFWRRGPRG